MSKKIAKLLGWEICPSKPPPELKWNMALQGWFLTYGDKEAGFLTWSPPTLDERDRYIPSLCGRNSILEHVECLITQHLEKENNERTA